MTRAARLFWVFASATLLVQLAWTLTVPTFRGPDEIDHTFRAESLVHGQLLSRRAADDGRGVLVSVSEDTVAAARGTCLGYYYSLPDNCTPVARTSDGRAEIATAAGSYNPLWYAVAGGAAAPFHGNAADFVMRAVTGLSLALLVGWAAAITARWDSTGWSRLGLLLTLTPIVGFSGATAAPNAITMGAGMLLWCAGLAIVERPERPPLAALAVACFLLMHTHTTGMVWAAIAFLVLFLLRSPGWWVAWFRADLRPRVACAATVVLAGVSELAWVRWAGTNALGRDVPGVGLPTVREVVMQQIVWLLQTVGAFPNRDRPAPEIIYALWLVPLAALLVLAVRYADRRTRIGLGIAGLLWVAVPVGLTLMSYRSEGFAWQGRYAMPLVSGIVLLAARSVAGRGRPATLWTPVVVVCAALAQAVSVASVMARTGEQGSSFALVEHLPLAAALITCTALAGGLVPLLLVRRPAPVPTTGDPATAPSGSAATATA